MFAGYGTAGRAQAGVEGLSQLGADARPLVTCAARLDLPAAFTKRRGMTAPLRLFNSLTRELETFEPIHPGEARVHACGPAICNCPPSAGMHAEPPSGPSPLGPFRQSMGQPSATRPVRSSWGFSWSG